MTRRCLVCNTSVIDAIHDYDALASVIFVNETKMVKNDKIMNSLTKTKTKTKNDEN